MGRTVIVAHAFCHPPPQCHGLPKTHRRPVLARPPSVPPYSAAAQPQLLRLKGIFTLEHKGGEAHKLFCFFGLSAVTCAHCCQQFVTVCRREKKENQNMDSKIPPGTPTLHCRLGAASQLGNSYSARLHGHIALRPVAFTSTGAIRQHKLHPRRRGKTDNCLTRLIYQCRR